MFLFKSLCISLLFFGFSFPLSAEMISMSVGRAEGHVFTSRETHMQHLLEIARQPQAPTGQSSYKTHPEDSRAFFDQVDKTILEYLISEEAKNFSAVRLTEEEFNEASEKLPSSLFQSSAWKALNTTSKEWKGVLWRKAQADKFIRFRAQSSVIPISDMEAKRYFDENRLKFGNLPFEQFKENIKVYLRRSQVESRLKDWYDVLRSKYKARNFLSEI